MPCNKPRHVVLAADKKGNEQTIVLLLAWVWKEDANAIYLVVVGSGLVA
jgi:hypothetical protein